MRFNDRELLKLCEGKCDLEGILNHIKPQGNDWTDWYQPSQFKDRYFKLVANLLFYYRLTDLVEPVGVLVLENAQIAYERPCKGIAFAFSITFKGNEKSKDFTESKHIFACRCESDVNKWVQELKVHSYGYWQTQLVILNTKISMKTGRDPVLDYMRSKNTGNGQCEAMQRMYKKSEVKKLKEKKATFYSHVESSSFYESSASNGAATTCSSNSSSTFAETKVIMNHKSTNVDVGNLIEL